MENCIKGVFDIFEKIVYKNPEGVAIIDSNSKITYFELYQEALKIHNNFIKVIDCKNRPVFIDLKPSWKRVACILGLVASRSAYVPLEESFISGNHSDYTSSIASNVIITDRDCCKFLSMKVFHLDQLCTDHCEQELKWLSAEDDMLEDIAYINFTSGSTGKPKGVQISNRNILSFTHGIRYSEFNTDSVFLSMAPLSFDASTFELFLPLLNGCSIVIVSERVPSISMLESLIVKHSITHGWFTSSFFNVIASANPNLFRTLKEVWVGGDVVNPKSVEIVYSFCSDISIMNGYGPTECTTFAFYYPIPREHNFELPIPIGKVIDNTDAYLLVDEQIVCLSPYLEGELLLGGPKLSKGYTSDELGSERFLTRINPITNETEKLYKTGDKISVDKDGIAVFQGRLDNQVKINGKRIDLNIVEHALLQIVSIENATAKKVVVDGDELLVGFIVLRPGKTLEIEFIKLEVKKTLPLFMVPDLIQIEEKSVLTGTGKFDRKNLQYRKTNTTIEIEENSEKFNLNNLLHLVSQVTLQHEMVKSDMRISDILTSLQIVKLHQQLESFLGIEILISTFFSCKTLDQLFMRIQEIRR
ncbi:MAG: Tyrocidine synthase 3 [Candidatus Celerinatantimonas neptuna]|nr:MAG: Tyrocidine synthase 3 [Candidatus Celerinatantimonas neptuna]